MDREVCQECRGSGLLKDVDGKQRPCPHCQDREILVPDDRD